MSDTFRYQIAFMPMAPMPGRHVVNTCLNPDVRREVYPSVADEPLPVSEFFRGTTVEVQDALKKIWATLRAQLWDLGLNDGNPTLPNNVVGFALTADEVSSISQVLAAGVSQMRAIAPNK